MPHESHHDGYLISDDPTLLQVDAVHAFLSTCYWATGIPRDIVARSLQNSLCIGIYTSERRQVGLARVITDHATFAYLCDVYVLEPHRRRGLAKAALKLLTTHPRLQNLRRFQLVTEDAHGLYAQFGFTPLSHPERHMEKRNPDVYRRASAPQ